MRFQSLILFVTMVSVISLADESRHNQSAAKSDSGPMVVDSESSLSKICGGVYDATSSPELGAPVGKNAVGEAYDSVSNDIRFFRTDAEGKKDPLPLALSSVFTCDKVGKGTDKELCTFNRLVKNGHETGDVNPTDPYKKLPETSGAKEQFVQLVPSMTGRGLEWRVNGGQSNVDPRNPFDPNHPQVVGRPGDIVPRPGGGLQVPQYVPPPPAPPAPPVQQAPQQQPPQQHARIKPGRSNDDENPDEDDGPQRRRRRPRRRRPQNPFGPGGCGPGG